jgi:hypothetical protein
MSYHEINIFNDQAKAAAKAADHKAAGRKNVTITPAAPIAGYESVIVYDNTDGNSEVVCDKDGPPNIFIVESDGG